MARRKVEDEGPPKDPSRVLFLALNMILLAFFILLVALSQPNKTKEAELAIELRKAFQSFGGAHLGLGSQLEERGVSRDKSAVESTTNVEAFLGELSHYYVDNDQAQVFSYRMSSEGLTIHLSEDFAFREGTDVLLARNERLFSALLDIIGRSTNDVRIEGHTDDRELRTERLHDNWELSAARAMAVYRYLTSSGQIPEERFIVAGYGSTRPRTTNLTEAGRSLNRRVTVTLVGELKPLGGG